jgi:hypothetical protein
MKNKKYDTVGTVSKFNRKFVDRDKIDTPNNNNKYTTADFLVLWCRHIIECVAIKLVL